jgi:hypothetical protein
MDVWIGAGGEVRFREGGESIRFGLFFSEDAPPGSLEALVYVHVPTFLIEQRPTLSWARTQGSEAEGGYMVPLPWWNVRVTPDGDRPPSLPLPQRIDQRPGAVAVPSPRRVDRFNIRYLLHDVDTLVRSKARHTNVHRRAGVFEGVEVVPRLSPLCQRRYGQVKLLDEEPFGRHFRQHIRVGSATRISLQ